MISTFIPAVIRLLEKYDVTFNLVDVGSRNGVQLFPDIAKFVEAWGFEPNPEEYQKLVTGNTDAWRIAGIKAPAYRALKYFPFAVSNQSGEAEFRVTRGPGAAGLLEPNVDELRRIGWKGKKYVKSFADDIFAVESRVTVPTLRLDEFIAREGIPYVDFLKIDVEGSEYEVLTGASGILDTVSAIRVEVCFIPFRLEQKLFSHVDVLLREQGFELIHFEVEPAQIGYKVRTEPLRYLPLGIPDPHGQPLSCDAIYVNRSIHDPVRALVQAISLIDRDYLDEAAAILGERGDLSDPMITELRQSLINYRGGTAGQRFRAAGYRAVDRTAELLSRVRRLVPGNAIAR